MPPPSPGESGTGSPPAESTGSGREGETAAGPRPRKHKRGRRAPQPSPDHRKANRTNEARSLSDMRRVALSTVLPWAWPSVARPMGGAGAVWPKAFPATTRGVCALHSGFFIYIDVMYVTMSCMQGATGSLRPNGCLCCSGMPRGGDWPVPRRVSSARRSDRSQRNSPGLNAQPAELPHALAQVMWRMQRPPRRRMAGWSHDAVIRSLGGRVHGAKCLAVLAGRQVSLRRLPWCTCVSASARQSRA